jgi:serine/threonine-protein kinase
MYELMSGRIPYEGPDTKTTNGYVVQGNAPPPTRHDPSIPEPLATVAMTALQPSDKRFRDASEAEQALREAWERCLTQGLVHPAVLAMDELTHDKAPARMHEARGMARPSPASLPVATAFVDTAENTAIDDKIAQKAQALVVESKKKRPGDDDPTTLMVREDAAKLKGDSTRQGLGQLSKTPAPVLIKPPPDTLEDDAATRVELAADTKSDMRAATPDGDKRARQRTRSGNMSTVLVVVIAVLLLAGATAIGLYVGGVVK